jgi:hypothetical protein
VPVDKVVKVWEEEIQNAAPRLAEPGDPDFDEDLKEEEVI